MSLQIQLLLVQHFSCKIFFNDNELISSNQCHSFRIMVFSAIIYWYWEAMLITYLSTRVIVLPFNSIATMLTKSSSFKIAVMPGSGHEDAFKFSKDPVWQEAWTDRIEPYLDFYRPYFSKLPKLNICCTDSGSNIENIS